MPDGVAAPKRINEQDFQLWLQRCPRQRRFRANVWQCALVAYLNEHCHCGSSIHRLMKPTGQDWAIVAHPQYWPPCYQLTPWQAQIFWSARHKILAATGGVGVYTPSQALLAWTQAQRQHGPAEPDEKPPHDPPAEAPAEDPPPEYHDNREDEGWPPHYYHDDGPDPYGPEPSW